jgi:hypothetical protein
VFAVTVALGAGTTAPVTAATFQTGDVFAAINSGLVAWYRADGTFVQNLNTTNSGFTTGMAFDAAGNLYVTNFSASRLAVFNTMGTLTSADFASGLSTPESIVFDQSGNFYVGNLGNGIRKYNSAGTFLGTVINTRVDFFDLTADQGTFRYGQEGANIPTVSNALPGVSGGNFNAVANVLNQAFAMRILPDGGLLVADNADIKRFDATGALTQTYDIGGVDQWFALNLDPDGTSFWSGSFGNGILRKFRISDGTVLQTIDTGTGSGNLFGVAIFGEVTVGGPGPRDVPEPSTLALLAIGTLGVWLAPAMGRRRSG